MEKTFEQIIADMPAYKDMSYWFIPSTKCGMYGVWDITHNNIYVGSYDESVDEFAFMMSEETEAAGIVPDEEMRVTVMTSFKQYQNRPEYYVSARNSAVSDAQMNQNLYEVTLLGAYLSRAYEHKNKDVDELVVKFQPCIDWLRSTDFYTCPASTQYHESFPGGLCYHTLKVVNAIRDIIQLDAFAQSVSIHSAVLCALVHDWCKIGAYEMYTRNVKNEETGQWEKVPAYRGKDKIMPMGHGASSYFLASKFFRFSPEEALAIRWHQGRWNVCDAEQNEFQQANEQFPSVHLLQFADMLAITNYANY